ncbi:MAG: general stress protein [Oligoflexus sp.]
MAKNRVVYALFRDRVDAERAVDALRVDGFRNEDISVLMSDNQSTKDFAHEKETKAPEGASVGAAAGAVAGGGLGWLVGIGSLAIPGVGPFIAAGPIVSTLAGVGAGGALGGIAGALIGMGIPEFEAKRFEGEVKQGKILMSIHCDDSDWVKRAKNILETQRAEDVSATGEESDHVVEGTDDDRPYTRVHTAESEALQNRDPKYYGDRGTHPNSPLL